MLGAVLVLLAALVGCQDDHEVRQDPACQVTCSPCDGEGEARVYVGTMPRAGIYGAPIEHLLCFPEDAGVCYRASGTPGLPASCFYDCGPDPAACVAP